jgi:hypothetical protein
VLVLVLDLVGLPGPPRILPGGLLLAVAVRHRASGPLLFLAAPLATAAITAVTLYLGGTYLHWTPRASPHPGRKGRQHGRAVRGRR